MARYGIVREAMQQHDTSLSFKMGLHNLDFFYGWMEELQSNIHAESVSEMLGHRSIRTTQIYAKVLDKKVGRDMNQLREKLGKRDDNSIVR